MGTLKHAVIALAVFAAASARADATPDYFKPLDYLVGHCWIGAFPDGKATDTHCYEWMLGREFIRDRHTVRSEGPDYAGEAVYHFDGATKSVKYRYWNSAGGVSDGSVEVAGNLTRVPEDIYRGKDGKVQKFQVDIERVGDTQYRKRVRHWDGKTWKDAGTTTFTRAD